MTGNSEQILKAIFGTGKLEEVSIGELRNLVESHPVFNAGHYLLSKKLQAENTEAFLKETQKTALHFHNPLWLQWLLENDADDAAAETVSDKVSLTQAGSETFKPAPADHSDENTASFWHRAEEPTRETASPLQDDFPNDLTVHQPFPEKEPAIHEISGNQAVTENPGAAATANDYAVPEEKPVLKLPEDPSENKSVAIAATFDSLSFHEGLPPETERLAEPEETKETAHVLAWKEELPDETTSDQSTQPPIEPAIPDAPPYATRNEPTEAGSEQPVPDYPHFHAAVPDELFPAAPGQVETALQEYKTGSQPELAEPPATDEIANTLPVAGEAPQEAEMVQAPVQPQETQDQPREDKPEEKVPPVADKEIAEDKGLVFEPYHTIDYFASQGIKLQLEEHPTDRFGKQLKSFTDWLKIMKRLPQKAKEAATEEEEDSSIKIIAEHSNEENDTITEAMAEVLARQGKTEKAIYIYNKLSLLDPSKMAYFAAKIQQLKTT